MASRLVLLGFEAKVTELALMGKKEGMSDEEVREAFGSFGPSAEQINKVVSSHIAAVNKRLDVELEKTKEQEQLIGKLRLDYRSLWMEVIMHMFNNVGIKASIEYPGFISISAPFFNNWSIGPAPDADDPDYWTGELTNEAGTTLAIMRVKDAALTGLFRKLLFEVMKYPNAAERQV